METNWNIFYDQQAAIVNQLFPSESTYSNA